MLFLVLEVAVNTLLFCNEYELNKNPEVLSEAN